MRGRRLAYPSLKTRRSDGLPGLGCASLAMTSADLLHLRGGLLRELGLELGLEVSRIGVELAFLHERVGRAVAHLGALLRHAVHLGVGCEEHVGLQLTSAREGLPVI